MNLARAAWLAGCLIAGLCSIPAAAQPREFASDALALTYDDAVWAVLPAAPPVLVQLRCVLSACGDNVAATLIADPRPFPQPGAGAFMPGAAAALLVDLRAQSLTPGARLRPESGTVPWRAGGLSGYRARYRIEDRALGTTSLVCIVLRSGGHSVQLRLESPRYNEEADARLDALVAGLTLKP